MEKHKKVVIAHLEDIMGYPPVINLIDNMLNNGHYVYLVSINIEMLPARLKNNKQLKYTNISLEDGGGIIKRIRRKLKRRKIAKKAIREYMKEADILWTTTDLTVRELNKEVLNYRHVMQLMELIQWYPLIGTKKYLKFPIDKYARQAWKVVVPEINRAYIQKIWWNLKRRPYTLPNKPYNLEYGNITQDDEQYIKKLQDEKRKVILYLGYIGHDRDIQSFVRAIEKISDEYCLYLVGEVSESVKDKFKQLVDNNNFVEYLGCFFAPKHLMFLKYCYIGLLPYVPSNKMKILSEINALYCAPNKIFEYAGYGVPMIGTDVPGLRYPFEQYNIGVCCEDLAPETIIDAIHNVDRNHDEMSANCKKFCDSVDLDEIVKDILYEEV